VTPSRSTATGEGPLRIDFIVGMARSGTTWLGRVLSEHPELAVFGETSFWGNLYVLPGADGLYGARELRKVLEIQRTRDWRSTTRDERDILMGASAGDYRTLIEHAIARVEPPVSPADVFRAIADAIAVSEGKHHVLEKTPHHVHWLPRIAAAFPDSKFVLTVRDPYEFVLSLRHLGNRLDGRIERILDRPWRHPLLAALAWRGYMNSIERARLRHGDRLLVIRTSELRERPALVVNRIQTFLDVPVRDLPIELPHANSSFAGRPRPEPGGDDIFWTNLVARSAMRMNGYSPRRIPFEPARLFASVLLLPLSVSISAVRLPRKAKISFREYLSVWLSR